MTTDTIAREDGMAVEAADDLMTAERSGLRQTSPALPAPPARPRSPVSFGGPGGTLTANDYQRVAAALGCDVATVRAVAEIESAHDPFLPDGTGRPSILFEAHQFNHYTDGRFLGLKDRNGVPLATVQWDRTLYGADGVHQYERLEDACALDRNAALMATSWGMFQIMGFNWREAGFGSCEEMVAAMCTGPSAHLTAFQNFIRSDTTRAEALQSTPPDFETFARHYNGTGSIETYAQKMRSSYDRLKDYSPTRVAQRAPVVASSPAKTDSAAGAAVPADRVARRSDAAPDAAQVTTPIASLRNAKMPDTHYSTVFENAASGAAAGLSFGLPGALLGAGIAAAVDLVPQLLPHLFGKNSANVQIAVKTVLADATGGKTDLDSVQAAIKADKADAIKQRLAEIAAKEEDAQRQADQQQRQADLEQIKLALADTASARDQTAALAKIGSPIAWGAPVVSVVVLLTFAAVVLLAFSGKATGSPDLLNVVLGTVGTMSTAVVSYWVGSSAGSAQKTNLLAQAPAITV
jgi:Spy/CpxP family protein refolding chaperone